MFEVSLHFTSLPGNISELEKDSPMTKINITAASRTSFRMRQETQQPGQQNQQEPGRQQQGEENDNHEPSQQQ